jgi:hypothetical protein
MATNNAARVSTEIAPAVARATEVYLASTKDLRARLVALQADADAASAATTLLGTLDARIAAVQA